VNPAVVPHRSEVNHDGNLYEVQLPGLQVPRCDACGELIFNEFAESQISDSLRARLGIMQPGAIQGERERLGLDQAQLARQLGVAETAVARWESGDVIPSRAMDNLLRLFFELPEARAKLSREAAGR
jgi:HTH-type transcriptional regulator / antitoxin MqsA